jgi:two-component system LytT family sensor kinase
VNNLVRVNKDSIVPHRRVVYWACQICGWAVHCIISIIASQSFARITYRIVWFYFFLSVSGIILTHGFRALARNRRWIDLPLGRLLLRVTSANLLMSFALVALGFAYSALIAPPGLGAGMEHSPTARVAAIVFFIFNDFTIFSLWSVIYFGVAYVERAQQVERDRYTARTAMAEAELRGLKRQLNPHFLFNALNSLRALIVEEPSRAQSAVTQLAGILRYHLTSGERSLVRLEEELATVHQYLALELMRFEDRLSVTTETDERAQDCLLPPLALQTLVENAIKYGLSQSATAGRITLQAMLEIDRLVVVVGNTGMLHGNNAQASTGLGLANLRTRLKLLFGEEASLELAETSANWVEARLTLPATRQLTNAPS